jgi:hypothetical protein
LVGYARTNSWAAGTDGNGKPLCRHDLPIVWTQQHKITGRAARIQAQFDGVMEPADGNRAAK